MFKTLIFTASLVGGALAVQAQSTLGKELVPNGGFESILKEPNTFDQLASATGWGNVTIGFSELFDPSAKVKTVGIPENFYGSMKPVEGTRYAGFFAWKDDMRRNYEGDAQDPFEPGWNAYSEYPWINLTEPLKEGHTYVVSFMVALAQNSDRAISGLGALIFPTELHYSNRSFLKERPQVVETKILSSRGEWTEITGTFVAEGDEQTLILGTFPTAVFDSARIIEGLDNQYAYYYLDRVSVKEVTHP